MWEDGQGTHKSGGTFGRVLQNAVCIKAALCFFLALAAGLGVDLFAVFALYFAGNSRLTPALLVEGYEDLILNLSLPTENDRHVLEAAIRGKAHVIVTKNSQNFSNEILLHQEMEAQHPDSFHFQFAESDPTWSPTWLIQAELAASLSTLSGSRVRQYQVRFQIYCLELRILIRVSTFALYSPTIYRSSDSWCRVESRL